MFSEQSRSIADACRFCWMCRHLCPVGLVTGKEANTARGRALLVSMDGRGFPLSADSAAIMYECSLCGACTNDCVTGYDPTVFTREARRDAVARGFLPPEVEAALERALAGNLTGAPADPRIAEAAAKLPATAGTLLCLGDAGRREGADSALALMRLLTRAGVDFTVLADEPDCGAMAFDMMGVTDEVRQMAQTFLNRVRAAGATSVVALDPSCAAFLKRQGDEWDLLGDIRVATATAFVDDLIKAGKLKPGKAAVDSAVFHDPCRLARDLDETQPARDILSAMGVAVTEMFLNRKLTKCCGGAVLAANFPDLAKKTAEARWTDAVEAGGATLVVACPSCRRVMGGAAPEGMALRDIFELLDEACS